MEYQKILYMGYGIINLIVFILYAIDKYYAVKRRWRVPEIKLLSFTTVGPFGAFIAMLVFRHKIRKPKFLILVPLLILLHVCVYYYLKV